MDTGATPWGVCKGRPGPQGLHLPTRAPRMVWKLGKGPPFFVPGQPRNQPERMGPLRCCFLPGLRGCQLSREGEGPLRRRVSMATSAAWAGNHPAEAQGRDLCVRAGGGRGLGGVTPSGFPPTSLLLDNWMDTAQGPAEGTPASPGCQRPAPCLVPTARSQSGRGSRGEGAWRFPRVLLCPGQLAPSPVPSNHSFPALLPRVRRA